MTDQTVISNLTSRLDTVSGILSRIHSDQTDALTRLSGDIPQPTDIGEQSLDGPGELGVLERVVVRLERLTTDLDSDNALFQKL